MENLEELLLAHNRRLEDIKSIEESKSLTTLKIISCSKVKDYEFAYGLGSSPVVFINRIDNGQR
jgi:hypothetical protein